MKRAFTLVETLAATALAAVLMLAVLKVLSGLPRAQAMMDQTQAAEPVPSRLMALIRYDLQNARSVHHMPGGIVLEGFGSLDPLTSHSTHLPARITYLVKADGAESWLIREQELMAGNVSSPMASELVCPNVTGIELLRIAEQADIAAAPQPVEGDIPGTVRLTLQFQHAPLFEQVVAVR